MIIVMAPGATPDQVDAVTARIKDLGYEVHISRGVERLLIGCVGHEDKTPLGQLESMPGVESAFPILKPFKLVSREFRAEPTVIDVDGVKIGGRELALIAGPCSVESREQILETAHRVKAAGAKILRGGAFKPRTSPYAFQGLRGEGLEYLVAAREATGLKIVTEIVNVEDLPRMSEIVDIFQIGARNCLNYAMLNAVGQTRKPVLLKRGMATRIEEFLMAAEYILSQGNYNVILCERGIRTFETYTRNTLDLSSVPLIKRLSHLPVMVDPSHGTGHWNLVEPMAKAAVAAGADGLMIEVHPTPATALSDGAQSLKPSKFERLVERLRRVAQAVDREL